MCSLFELQSNSFQSFILDDVNDYFLFILWEIIYSLIQNLQVFIFVRQVVFDNLESALSLWHPFIFSILSYIQFFLLAFSQMERQH